MLCYQIVPVTPFVQNATVLWCSATHQAVVCDPGGDLPLIEAVLEREQLVLKSIWLTHGHVDHAGAAAILAQSSGVSIVGPHHDDLFWLESLEEQGNSFGFRGAVQSFQPDRFLNDGDQVMVGNETLHVIHCPGHTPGHVVFYHMERSLAIVGDVLFQGAIGRTDFLKGNHEDLVHSIREKLFPLGDHVQFIPGHGPMSSFAIERSHNPFVGDHVIKK